MQYFKVFFLIMGIIFFLTNSIKGLFIYLGLVLAYFIFVFLYSLGTSNNPTRKFLLSAWNGPNSPIIYIGYTWEIDKAQRFIKSLKSHNLVVILKFPFRIILYFAQLKLYLSKNTALEEFNLEMLL